MDIMQLIKIDVHPCILYRSRGARALIWLHYLYKEEQVWHVQLQLIAREGVVEQQHLWLNRLEKQTRLTTSLEWKG